MPNQLLFIYWECDNDDNGYNNEDQEYHQGALPRFCWNFDSFQVNSQKLGVQAPQNVEFE